MTFDKIIEDGRSQGYIRFPFCVRNQHLLLQQWETACILLEIPLVYVIDLEDGETARVHFELLEGLRFTPKGYAEAKEILSSHNTSGAPSSRGIKYVAPIEQATALIQRLLEVCKLDRAPSRQQDSLDAVARPYEGIATCVNNKGYEERLIVGERYYIREIPNQIDHCIVIRDEALPLVGVSTLRFELPFDYETF